MRPLETVEKSPTELDDLSLELCHRVALRLIHSGIETDGELLLSLVVWPTSQLTLAAIDALGNEAA